MDNGCPKCKELTEEHIARWGTWADILCLDCQLEQAEADVLKAMNRVEELKQEKAKEKQNENS